MIIQASSVGLRVVRIEGCRVFHVRVQDLTFDGKFLAP